MVVTLKDRPEMGLGIITDITNKVPMHPKDKDFNKIRGITYKVVKYNVYTVFFLGWSPGLLVKRSAIKLVKLSKFKGTKLEIYSKQVLEYLSKLSSDLPSWVAPAGVKL